jgi:hypothetical protein
VTAGEYAAAISGLAIPARFSPQHFAITFGQKNKPVRFASNERTFTIDPP